MGWTRLLDRRWDRCHCPRACRLLCELIGADAAALFWMDAAGLPTGFFHEESNPAARDLFTNAFEQLFVGEDGLNVATLVRRTGARCRASAGAARALLASNTFNLLMRAGGWPCPPTGCPIHPAAARCC